MRKPPAPVQPSPTPPAPLPGERPATVHTQNQLEAALDAQARMPRMRIGETLVGLGFITADQLRNTLQTQRGVPDQASPLGELLIRAGLICHDDLRAALVRKMGYPVVSVASYPVDDRALKRVPAQLAMKLNVLPLQTLASRMVVVMDDPTRTDALAELEFLIQTKVAPVLPLEPDLARWINDIYRRHGQVDTSTYWGKGQVTRDLVADLEQQKGIGTPIDEEDVAIEQADSSLVRLVNTMIVEAHERGVSDIHVETHPGREKLGIRFRKDGVLMPYLELPHYWRQALLARIKVMCGLDISERRHPQDGKINFAHFVPGYPIELRVATIPTNNGLEDAVLRLLDSSRLITIPELGLTEANQRALLNAINRPYGLVLCVGPTGSGKTTTLHAALSHLNQPSRKIWTAEDPIEITQPGLRQVQINPKIDFTFAKALRAFLRADPDVIMVGEIRDSETAQIAIESSLTGHLVLSTLHTNSATETVARLLELGLDPFNFSDALLAVLAQRLVRKLCPHCRQAEPISDVDVEEWLDDYLHAWSHPIDRPDRTRLLQQWILRYGQRGLLMRYRSVGCQVCENQGTLGRLALHEVLPGTRQLRRMIQSGARQDELLRQAMQDGLRTLRQDGIEKALAGLTTLEEVRAST